MKLPAIRKQLRTLAELEIFVRRQIPRTWDAVTVHDCADSQLLKGVVEKLKTGGILALKGGDHRILAEVFEYRWPHYFCQSGNTVWTRICRAEGSSSVSWKEQPLAFYLDLLQRGVSFSFLRYGDGEWNCALETMCSGYGFQRFTPALCEDIQMSLIEYHKDSQYIMTLAPVRHFRDRGLYQWELITAFLREYDLDIEWGCTEPFNRAICAGRAFSFIQHLQQSDIIIVGPKRNRPLQTLFPSAVFVDIPDKQCHTQLDEIQKGILAQRHPAIILITAGPACVVLIHKLWPLVGDRSTLIDFGSLWAPFIGMTEHGAHVNILKIPGLMAKNVGKFG